MTRNYYYDEVKEAIKAINNTNGKMALVQYGFIMGKLDAWYNSSYNVISYDEYNTLQRYVNMWAKV